MWLASPLLTGPVHADEGAEVRLQATATDPAGVNDTIRFEWSVTRTAMPLRSGTGDDVGFVPDDNGSYVVGLITRDDDGGGGGDAAYGRCGERGSHAR